MEPGPVEWLPRSVGSMISCANALILLHCSSFQRSHHNPNNVYTHSVLVGCARTSGWDVQTQRLDLPTWPGPQGCRIPTRVCGFHAILLEREVVSGVFLGFQPIRGSYHHPDAGYSPSVDVGRWEEPRISWQDVLVDCRRH